MRVLIELYDANEPILNVLPVDVLRPELLVVLGDSRLARPGRQKPIVNYLRMAGIDIPLQFEPMNVYDIAGIQARLEALFAEHGAENCVVDASGGFETLLLAAGACCRKHGVRMLMNRPGSNLMHLMREGENEEMPYDVHISVRQAIALAGGELKRNDRIRADDLTEELLDIGRRVFSVFLKYRRDWHAFTLHLQQVNVPGRYIGEELRCPSHVLVDGKPCLPNRSIYQELHRVGVLLDLKASAQSYAFRFCTPRVGDLLCDVGVWLELHVYSAMRRSGLFDDIELSAIVSWNDDDGDDEVDVVNEIDITATAGIGQLFISCKTRAPDANALEEIALLTRRFGSRYATPVVVTSQPKRVATPALMRRASEMGVEWIALEDLSDERLLRRVKNLCGRWDRQRA